MEEFWFVDENKMVCPTRRKERCSDVNREVYVASVRCIYQKQSLLETKAALIGLFSSCGSDTLSSMILNSSIQQKMMFATIIKF